MRAYSAHTGSNNQQAVQVCGGGERVRVTAVLPAELHPSATAGWKRGLKVPTSRASAGFSAMVHFFVGFMALHGRARGHCFSCLLASLSCQVYWVPGHRGVSSYHLSLPYRYAYRFEELAISL